MLSKTLLRKQRNKEKVAPNKKERKTNITVESFVKQHHEIFKGLLTGENVIVFSDSDTDIEDRPPPQVFPVRMTQKQEQIKARETQEKAPQKEGEEGNFVRKMQYAASQKEESKTKKWQPLGLKPSIKFEW